MYQRKFKDRLFVFIFGRDDPMSKKWRLELYNGLKETEDEFHLKLSDAFEKKYPQIKFTFTKKQIFSQH